MKVYKIRIKMSSSAVDRLLLKTALGEIYHATDYQNSLYRLFEKPSWVANFYRRCS